MIRQGTVFFLLTISIVSAARFEGHIVKLKENSAFHLKTQALGEKLKFLSTSFGRFLHIQDDELEEYKNNPDVEFVEPNYLYKIGATVIDKTYDEAFFTQQWGLHNSGDNSGSMKQKGVAGVDINAIKAWQVTKGKKDVVIAVIDTGVDYTHKKLSPNMWVNTAEKNGLPNVDDDGNGYIDDIYGYNFDEDNSDPIDRNGHGTHCAGVIGATHEESGLKGVMGEVQIMALKFLSDSGRGDTLNAIKAIDYAIKMGADILSNSWGGGERTKSLEAAIQRAQEAGIVFVTSAGNSNSDNDRNPAYPANYQVDNVISVGAFAANGSAASFSNYGANSVHVFAPGVDIISTYPKQKYKKMSGTSMAAPHVSAILGLIKSLEPHLTPKQMRERLIETSAKSHQLSTKSLSGGRVDAYSALE